MEFSNRATSGKMKTGSELLDSAMRHCVHDIRDL